MKNLLPSLASAVLLAAFGLGRDGAGQEPGDKALQRARVIEEQEGDLRAAEAAYRALVDDDGSMAGVRNEAMLRLGRMWWRLGRQDEARALLQRVQQSGGEPGAAAAAILEGQGPEGQAAAEVAARTRDAIARLLGEKPATGNPTEDLRWLGTAAMPELLRQLGERRSRTVQAMVDLAAIPGGTTYRGSFSEEVSSSDPGVNGLLYVTRCARRLAEFAWQTGGSEAERFLRGAIADESVHWRRLIASASRNAGDGLLPLVTQMLRDEDPDGTVPNFALANSTRLPLDAVVAALGAPVPFVRAQAWWHLARLPVWSTGQGREAVRLLEPHLLKALADPDPETARKAFEFLRLTASSTERGVELLLEWLPRVALVGQQGGAPARPRLDSVVRAARALGAVGTVDGKDEHRKFLAQLAEGPVLYDPARTAAHICDLVELGYDRYGSTSWLRAAVGLAREAKAEADLVRIIGLLGRSARSSDTAAGLTEDDLPAAGLAGLQARLQTLLPRVSATEGTTEPPRGRRGSIPGKRSETRKPDTPDANEARFLFLAIGRTRNAAALSFLREQLTAWPAWRPEVASAAVNLTEGKSDAGSGLLRELLVSSGLGEGDQDPWQRNRLFAELARRGDVEAIALLPRAYELGLVASSGPGNTSVRGAQWLSAVSETEVQRQYQGQPQLVPPRPGKLHGYDDQRLEEAWRTLLQSPALFEVLSDVARLRYSVFELAQSVRLQVVELVVARLPELLRQFSNRSDPNFGTTQHATLLAVTEVLVRATPAADDAGAQRYRAAVQKLLATEDLGAAVTGWIPAGSMPLLVGAVRPLLAGPKSLTVMQALQRAGIALTTADLLVCLRSQSQDRPQFLAALPPDAAPEIIREVEAMTRDPNVNVRHAACTALGRTLSPDAVATLLPALRDPNDEVGKAAAEALQRIRQYQEQRAFWDQFQQGVGTGKENATAKLLIQGKPGANKEQRVLALRSLGALGAPEALPYLIEWSQEQDAEVAAACKAAIARIHQQAGVK